MTDETNEFGLTTKQTLLLTGWLLYTLFSLVAGPVVGFPTPEGTILESLLESFWLLSLVGIVIGFGLLVGVSIVQAATLASKWKGDPTEGSWAKIQPMGLAGVGLFFGGLPAFFAPGLTFLIVGLFLAAVAISAAGVTYLSEKYGDGLVVRESVQNQLGLSSLLLFVLALMARLAPFQDEINALLILAVAGALVILIVYLGESSTEGQTRLDSFE